MKSTFGLRRSLRTPVIGWFQGLDQLANTRALEIANELDELPLPKIGERLAWLALGEDTRIIALALSYTLMWRDRRGTL